MSIEFACSGIPVICCGAAWIKNKNLTFDPKNKSEYIKYLDFNLKEIKNIQKSKKEKALKFAYYYFFKKMIKVNLISLSNYRWPRRIAKVSSNKGLKQDQNFNLIIDQIFNNRDIVKE